MDVSLITLPKPEAKIKFEAYRKRLAKMRHSKANEDVIAEYKAAEEGYKALANGTPLIDLEDIFNECPKDEKGRHRLAIGRADRKQVYYKWGGGSNRVWFITDMENIWSPRPTLTVELAVDQANAAKNQYDDGTWMWKELTGYSLLPMVPLDVRPEAGQLKDWFVLWEVEQWSDKKIQAVPPYDPYLLKHLGGTLYAVIAEWDLTDLERAIMKGRKGD